MSVKKRILAAIEKLNRAQLERLERDLQELLREKPSLEEEFRLLDELAAPMSDEDKQIFNRAIKRRPWFGNRTLEAWENTSREMFSLLLWESRATPLLLPRCFVILRVLPKA